MSAEFLNTYHNQFLTLDNAFFAKSFRVIYSILFIPFYLFLTIQTGQCCNCYPSGGVFYGVNFRITVFKSNHFYLSGVIFFFQAMNTMTYEVKRGLSSHMTANQCLKLKDWKTGRSSAVDLETCHESNRRAT